LFLKTQAPAKFELYVALSKPKAKNIFLKSNLKGVLFAIYFGKIVNNVVFLA
jgi:hypothetical protein